MVTKKEKDELIYECSKSIQDLVHELESKIGDDIRSCDVWHGDLDSSDHTKVGTKIYLSTDPEINTSSDVPIEFDGTFSAMSAQDIILDYHEFEREIKRLMAASVGLDFITDKYLEIIEIEKTEARKALGEENEELFKLL